MQGIGVRRFVDEKLPELRARRATVIVNVCGTTLDEYVEVSRILSDARGRGRHRAEHLLPEHQGRRHPVRLQPDRHVRRRQRRAQGDDGCRSFPKLTPNVTDVASFARAAEDAGADAVSLVNTFLAMVIDVETRRPKISNVVGGLSGPAIRPIAVRMVYECRQAVKIPVVGMGGIVDARDALEFMIAGAAAVQVGHRQLRRPLHLAEAARRHRRLPASVTTFARIADLVGTDRHPRERQELDQHVSACRADDRAHPLLATRAVISATT